MHSKANQTPATEPVDTDQSQAEAGEQMSDAVPDGSAWPKVSIVTPSLNQAQFIEETLLSVKGQDYPHLEHLVIDGGSTDGTLDILTHYEAQYNLRWISEPDEGQSDAVNKGFRMASGEIVGWINSDDTYLDGAIRAAVQALIDHTRAGWVYGDAYWIDQASRVLWKAEGAPFDLKRLICRGQYIVQPTVFFRRTLLRSVGWLDTRLETTMDYDFFIRFGLRSKGCYIPATMATRRLHPDAKTTTRALRFSADAVATLDKLFARHDLPEAIVQARNTAYGARYAQWGQRDMVAGNFRDAREHLWRAVRLAPRLSTRQTLALLALFFQSFLGVRFYIPGQGHRQRMTKAFRAVQGEIVVDWFRNPDGPPNGCSAGDTKV